MQEDGIFKQMLESSENLQEIEAIFRKVDEATKDFGVGNERFLYANKILNISVFQLALTLANIRQTQAIKGDTEVRIISLL